jgi:hypothetical protein
MLTRQIALTSLVPGLSAADLMRIAGALQKQVVRDFSPIWRRRATVAAFAQLEDVPLGYWPIIVIEQVPQGAGVHLDEDGQPYALVEMGPAWSLAASHECLEMLADPFGARLVAGDSPKNDQGRVEFLVEVCDPCEASDFAYAVNGVMVSDFYSPHFFDPAAAAGVRYSFSGQIQRPRQVLPGGYLSWHDADSNQWWQETFFGSTPTFRNLGRMERGAATCPREFVNRGVPEALEAVRRMRRPPILATALDTGKAITQSKSKAEAWRRQIAALTGRR